MDFNLLDLFGGTALGGNLFGAPGVGQLFNDMPVPGMPATGGQPQSMLAENPADLAAPGAIENSYVIPKTGQTIAANSPAATTPMPKPAAPMPLATPAGAGRVPDPERADPGLLNAPLPGTVGPPPAIVPPKIDTALPGAGGPPAAAPAIAPAAPAAAPGTVPGAGGKPGDPSMMDKLQKAVAGIPGMGGGKALQPANIGSAGQPHIPQGGAAIMQDILKAHAAAVPIPGKVPGMPGVFQKRIQGLI